MARAVAAEQQQHNEPGHAWAWAMHWAAALLTWRGHGRQGGEVPWLLAFETGKAVCLSLFINV